MEILCVVVPDATVAADFEKAIQSELFSALATANRKGFKGDFVWLSILIIPTDSRWMGIT